MSTLIQGGLAALPGELRAVGIRIEGERIVEIGEGLSAGGAEVIDASGCLVLPGAIDTHTHFDLPVSGTVTADNFETGTRAAILGGTTTVLDFVTQEKGHTLREAFDLWRGRMEDKANCDVAFHMAITDWNAQTEAEIGEMAALGVTSYKLYMAYPALQVEDDVILTALRRVKEVGGIIGFHCENGRLVEALIKQQKAQGNLGPAAHPLSRPPEVEAEAIARLLRIAQIAGAPVNIVHLSSRLGLETIRQTRAPGQVVHIETCPHYLLLTDERLAFPDGAKYVCSPPLRKQEDADALFSAVASGEIETIGTDHCSFNFKGQKEKGKEDFSKIPNGLPGVEHRLSLMLTEGAMKGRVPLLTVVRALCENPAKLFGLYPQKGVLSVGSDADLVVFDPRAPFVIRAAAQAQNVDYTPYEGFVSLGAVRDVFLRGRQVVVSGHVACQHQGAFLATKPSKGPKD